MNCLSCKSESMKVFLDLGDTPLANDYLTEDYIKTISLEETFPLRVAFCTKCYMVQLTDTVNPKKIYEDYAYFSSYSTTFLEHARKMVEDLSIEHSLIDGFLEIASNDGYLLQYVKEHNCEILGVEPAANIAKVANANNIPTLNEFFNTSTVPLILERFGKKPRFIIGNNVLAHVPDINDFVEAISKCLVVPGLAVFEFPYLPILLNNMEFDTIYHEHVFYYSIIALKNLFERHGMEIFDVKFFSIHGGSVRIYVQHEGVRPIKSIVSYYEMNERLQGLDTEGVYMDFGLKVEHLKADLKYLLRDLKQRGFSLAAYGAPAKGNTLLNTLEIGRQILDFTVDTSPHKQGKFLPGSQIPIYPREHLLEMQPDYTLLLPWNFADEIMAQQQEYLNAGGQFIIPVPTPRIVGK